MGMPGILVERAWEWPDRVKTGAAYGIVSPEVRATLARLRRETRLTEVCLSVAKNAFEEDWQAFLRINARESLLRRAGCLAETFSLKGLDSVHLAAAGYAQLQTGERIAFARFDERLSVAAAGLGLAPLWAM